MVKRNDPPSGSASMTEKKKNRLGKSNLKLVGNTINLLKCPVLHCPKPSYKTEQGLFSHVNSHCRLRNDSAHHVPSTFFTDFNRRYCNNCSCSVPLNPRTHVGHEILDSMPPPESDHGTFSNPVECNSADICDDLPQLEEILACALPTVRHIPRACRNKWSEAFSSACRTIVQNPNNENGYKLLFMLPICCLRLPPRSGKKKKRDVSLWFKSLLDRWINQDFSALWLESLSQFSDFQTRKQSKKLNQQEQNSRRALLMVREQNLSKATQCLLSAGLAENTEETFNILCSKHPAGPSCNEEFLPTDACYSTSSSEVNDVLASFARGSSPGRSCLRFEHLKDAITCPTPAVAEKALQQLTALINLFLTGCIPPTVRAHFCGGKLIALKKPAGGIRPIAIGETLRRLCAKLVCRQINPRVKNSLFPTQVGVGVKSGCESVIHSVRELLFQKNSSSKSVLLKVDLENAFNLVSRPCFLEIVREQFPEFFNWVNCCYGEVSILDFENLTIDSAAGVQQGDPLGPALFALALSKLTAKISELSSLDLNVWFFDDGVLVGSPEEVRKALAAIEKYGPEFGLHVNLNKSELFNLAASQDQMFPAPIKRLNANGFLILGGFVGDPDFESLQIAAYFDKLRPLFDALNDLQHAQAEFRILSACLSSCKINHLLRTCPPSSTKDVFNVFDDILRLSLERILGRPLSDMQWQNACLPNRYGGLGLRAAAISHVPAYIASRVETMPIVELLTRHQFNLRDDAFFQSNFEMLKIPFPQITVEELFDDPVRLQFRLTKKVTDVFYASFFPSLDIAARANVLSYSLPHACSYLSAPPMPNLGLELSSQEFVVALCRQLRVPIFSSVSLCSACNSALLDTFGDHSLVCASSGDRILRHNAIRDLVYETCKAANLSPKLEPSGLLQDSQQRPGDIVLPIWSCGQKLAVDVTIVSPFQTSLLPNASEQSGFAARRAEERKISASESICQESGLGFQPVAFETSSGISPSSSSFLKTLLSRCADVSFVPRALVIRQFFQKSSVIIQRLNSNMIISRSPPDHGISQHVLSNDLNNYCGTLQPQPSISRAPMTPLVAGLTCIVPHDLSFAPSAQSEASQSNSYTEEEAPTNEWFSNRRMSEPIETTQEMAIVDMGSPSTL